MGTLRGDNGGERPPNGDGLPNLPPEWGHVVIPDDASELASEAALVRKQLRRHARRDRWRRRFGLRRRQQAPGERQHALGLPLLIMAIAIIATLTSLFAIAWPSKPRQSANTPAARPPAQAAASEPVVADVTLTDPAGTPLHLRDLLPAVVLLVNGCACADLVAGTSQVVGHGVTVLAVARLALGLPSIAPGGQVRAAVDHDDTLSTTFGGPDTGVTAVLIKGTGAVVRIIHKVRTVDDFRPYLNLVG
ncbi:MAG: hypothetical protein J2P15_09100 [Micromonosporaceae bacterium]|nr:hypothetical protein [Micromonosporaceae bacterium]